MLRKILDAQLAMVKNNRFLSKLLPIFEANDVFFYEAPNTTKTAPHIRDAVDVKRWMMLVVIALLPTVLVAIWNTGLQSFVYSSGDYRLMNEYMASSQSWKDYWTFAQKDNRYLTILKEGALAFFPVVLISYAVGGFWEALFACIRKHDIAEGFLVTGILYPLILPPTIPYWMVAVGVSAGVIFGKEVFGGTGMNIMNPALACRAFLFFAYPGKMSGDVWVGRNSTTVRESLAKMNLEANTTPLDGYSQATPLARFNVSPDIKRIHVDAIASNNLGNQVATGPEVEKYFHHWNTAGQHHATFGELSADQMRQFVTSPLAEGGLGLSPGSYEDAYRFSALNYGIGHLNEDGSFLLGNQLGSFGETSVIACLLGAAMMLYWRVASWRTMLAMLLGAFGCAALFQYGSLLLSHEGGAWAPAHLAFPAYKHLLLGGLVFGAVYMITDPVSSPSRPLAQWIYGLLVGAVAIVIRLINPAYPEGVMLAIILGNCFAPLLDYYAASYYRRPHRVQTPV